MPKVLLPDWISKHLGANQFQYNSSELRGLLIMLCDEFPQIKKYIFTHGELFATSTALFINNKLIQHQRINNEIILLEQDDVIEIEPAIVGG